METIAAAAISAGVTLLVCLINNRAESAKTRALLSYRLSELEKKQDKHNSLMERTFRLEGRVDEVVHEIVDLKKYHHREG